MGGSTGNTLYGCSNCQNPLAHSEDLLSKDFVVNSGQAYMFAHAMNITLGHEEDKQLLTGLYTICFISCNNCGQELGWKYIRAYDATQKFKAGKFILEKAKIVEESC
ncbi:Protein yippee-like [Actinidia chinensis var. chinensis]|uniref:Protein yippee-like n=1 Tax=Actinidia chinensis var. chinensis TaxID=1590841 RepID=A0A2R6RQH8_ACTCC|nr:Protein yippee-like [Actinidia chinensis var. chinensis]